jgi:CubicO group peptidase (beta-lactamase class C family)
MENVKTMLKEKLKDLLTFAVFTVLLFNSATVYPIIIRHDRADADYRKLGERYRDACVDVAGATGTLLAPRWVLAAAHTLDKLIPGHPAYDSSVLPIARVGGRDYKIDKIVQHPSWNKPRTSNDIVLVRLAESVKGIVPTRLYREKDEVGKVVTFVGRGTTGNGKEGAKGKDMILRGAHDRVETADERWITFIFDAPDTPNVLPLEGAGGSGDSGGPALIEKDGHLYTLGVLSHNRSVDGPDDVYGMKTYYTRVSIYADWIEETIKNETNAPSDAEKQAQQLKSIDAYIEKAISDWRIPGLSIAVVKGDKIIYAKGYGVRETGKPERVNEQTLFPVGSITKSFTAAGIGVLVDEKKMAWDDAVTKYLPDFQLYDANLTQSVTMRDLLAHRTGLPRANGTLLSPYNRSETLQRMRFLKPAAPLRSAFTYNNQMYLAAGQALEKVAQTNWEEFIKQRFFAPLKMTASNLSINALKSEKNFAAPHAVIGDKVQILPFDDKDSIAPAGAVNSNAVELANWARLFLNNGKSEGKQILSPTAIRIMHGQQTVIPVGSLSQMLFPSTHFQGYGMGWFLRDYRGRKVVEHGGNTDGMTAQIGLLPEENIGIVILSNMNENPAPTAIMYRVFDSFLGDADKQVDISAEYFRLTAGGRAQMQAQEKELAAKRQPDVKLTLPLDSYAGNYVNDLYGAAEISNRNGKLYLKFNDAAQGELEHWEKDTFRISWTSPFFREMVGKTPFAFVVENEKITGFKNQNLADYKRVETETKPK